MTLDQFEHIYRQYYPILYLYAGDFVSDKEVCTDIVADVFMKIWEMRDKINTDTIESYMRSCVRNECFLYLRKVKNFDKYSDFARLNETELEYIDSADERVDSLLEAIDSLPEKTREILRQCYLNDKTYREVGQMMNLSDSGVKKHIVKAYSAIREFFKIRNRDTD